MTLNITILTPWGIWQCSDFRLADYNKSPTQFHDMSVKHIVLHCPDGTALITYTGLGRFSDRSVPPSFPAGKVHYPSVNTADWLAQRLSGVTRTIIDTSNQISRECERLVAAIRYTGELTLSIGAFIAGQPRFFLISNTYLPNHTALTKPGRQFFVSEYSFSGSLVVYAGELRAVNDSDRQLMLKVTTHRPRRQEEFTELMHEVNERASSTRNLGRR